MPEPSEGGIMDITPKKLFELSRKVDQMRKDVQKTNKELKRLLKEFVNEQKSQSKTLKHQTLLKDH